MQKKYPDVALVIQGPITCVKSWEDGAGKKLEEYKNLFGQIIVSSWDYCETAIDLANLYHNRNVDIITSSSELDPDLVVQYNMGHQAITTLRGLRASTKPYTLKMRTDEYYSNLEVLVDKFYEGDCKKWVCAPVCFLPATQYKYHAADHLFIAPTDRLINTFKNTIGRLYMDAIARNRNNEPAAEITFTQEYIWHLAGSSYQQTMKENFDIVPLESLMPFSIKIGTKGHNFTTPEQVYQDMPFLQNATLEELIQS